MVLDSEPKPVRQNVDIHIPSPEAGEFKPKTSEAAPQPAAPIKGLPEAPAADAPPPPDTAVADATSAASAQGAARATVDSPPPKIEAPAPRDRSAVPAAKDQPDMARSPLPPAKRDAIAPQRPAAGDRTEPPRAASGAPKSKPEAPARSERTEPSRASNAPAAKSEASAARPATASDRAESARNTAAAPAKRPADTEAGSGSYVVQVAALADAAKARQLQKQMSGAGLKTYTEVISTKTGEMTRVRAGPYATREAAEKARAQLKKAGLDGQVVAK
jgi:DedD protein